MRKIRVAMIGYGGIARSHNAGYNLLEKEGEPIQLVAVCDIDPSKFESYIGINIETGTIGLPADIHTYTSVDDLLANESFDMADICLPSYLHKEYAVKLLRAGKHVLSEKPMALSEAECDEMIAASNETGCRLMIGQCLRFNAQYLFLKHCVESGVYGKARHLFMNRLSSQPTWGFEQWYQDTDKSGGCILDMHIHDIDMVRFLFGEPEAVSSITLDGETRYQVVNTRVFYKDMLVSINGSWGEASGTPFQMDYRIRFDKATILFDGSKVMVYPEEGEPFEPKLPCIDHIAEEIRMFAHSIIGQVPNESNPPESARETVKVIERMRESALRGGEIVET